RPYPDAKRLAGDHLRQQRQFRGPDYPARASGTTTFADSILADSPLRLHPCDRRANPIAALRQRAWRIYRRWPRIRHRYGKGASDPLAVVERDRQRPVRNRDYGERTSL